MRRRAWALLLLFALLLGGAVPALADDHRGSGRGQGGPHGHEASGADDGGEDEGGGRHGEGRDGDDDRDEHDGHDEDKHDEDDGDDGDERKEGRKEGKEGKEGKGAKEAKSKGRATAAAEPDLRTAPLRADPGPSVQLHQDITVDGDRAVYEVLVRNDGDRDAPAVALAADLPAGGWRTAHPDCTVVASHLSCLVGPLAPGGTVVVQATGRLAGGSPYPAIVQAITPLP